MIKSRGAKGKARVTFTIDPRVGAQVAAVCGEWNDWSPGADTMHRDAEGGFTVTVDLDAGRTYRFRYLLDGQRWDNDWAADAYVRNDFGGDDSVVDLTALAEAVPPATRKAPARRTPAKEAAVQEAEAVPPTARKAPARKTPARGTRAKEAAEAGAVSPAGRRTPAKKAAPGQTAEKAPPATKRARTLAKEAAPEQAAGKAAPAAKLAGKTAK